MGSPMNFANISTIPTWGLVALGLSLVGTIFAGAIGVWLRRVPAWILVLVPLAAAGAWAASIAPTSLTTLTVALVSLGLALVQLLAGTLGLAPEEARNDD